MNLFHHTSSASRNLSTTAEGVMDRSLSYEPINETSLNNFLINHSLSDLKKRENKPQR